MSRQAIMRADRTLIEELWPEGIGMQMLGSVLGERYEALKKVLMLPDNCIITGVSLSLEFYRDLIAIRIESPDFVETAEACILPDVEAVYHQTFAGKPKFLWWEGQAVQSVVANPTKARPIRFREFL